MHTTLLLDISSGSVGAGIAGIEEGSLPKILFTTRKEFSGTEAGMLSALKRSMDEVFKKGLLHMNESMFPNHLDHVVVTISSPWSQSEMTSSYKSGGDYFESAPVGGMFVTSSANKDLVRRIENEVIRTLGVKRGASVQSFAYVLSKVFTNFSNSDKPVLLARFEGETTELVLVKEGGVEKVSSIHFGPASIVSHLSQKLDVPSELAESLLSLLARGELDRDTAVRIDTLLSSVEDKWIDMWEGGETPIAKEVLFIAHERDSAIAQTLLSSVLPNASVGDIRSGGYFIPHIARGKNTDAAISMLASFSRMIA